MDEAGDRVGETLRGRDRPDKRPPPAVGAVAIRDGELIAEASRGQNRPGEHAEFGIVSQLGERSGALEGATIYTTLEPCTQRSDNETPCATRLVDEGVARVFIGSYDPDPHVQRLGWARLRNAGIELCDFAVALRDEIEELIEPFRRNYTHGSVGRTARFDFNQNNGNFVIEENETTFRTKWGGCGSDAVYAEGPPGTVALAKSATTSPRSMTQVVTTSTGTSRRSGWVTWPSSSETTSTCWCGSWTWPAGLTGAPGTPKCRSSGSHGSAPSEHGGSSGGC